MPQHPGFDRRWPVAYLAVWLIGCGGGPGRVVPLDAPQVERRQVTEWVSATIPQTHRLHRFKWLFQDERSSAGGRGSARIAPPDSLRFDVAGPFGSGAAAAAVIGDSLLWADPPDAVTKLVPNYPLLWAMFGIARLPEDTDSLNGISREGTTAWRYVSGPDTVSYVRTPAKLTTEVRHGRELVGRAEATLGGDGAPTASRLLVPSAPAKLTLTFLSTARAEFAPEIWISRQH
jgi:hypothetical protein